jgi:HEAT repeat protein
VNARILTLLLLLGARPAAGQLERRVAQAPDGQVRMTYAAREGVVGNGRNIISWDCDGANCRSQHMQGNYNDADDRRGLSACDTGPVRVTLWVRGGAVQSLRVAVGGTFRAGAGTATDLGTVPAAEAARYLLTLDVRHAVFAAAIADSATIWPDLLRMAKDTRRPRETRKQAVFWLGQAAEEAATRGLEDLIDSDMPDRDVQESAVFAISQRPREEGVPTLIRVAKTHRDPEIRRKAIFWLGQSEDPRALALFEELLTKP